MHIQIRISVESGRVQGSVRTSVHSLRFISYFERGSALTQSSSMTALPSAFFLRISSFHDSCFCNKKAEYSKFTCLAQYPLLHIAIYGPIQ